MGHTLIIFRSIASIAFWTLPFHFSRLGANGPLEGFLAQALHRRRVPLFLWCGHLPSGSVQESKDPNRALIIDSAADLKYGPAVSARSVESLQMGEQVQLISERGDWTFCRASTGNLGWIPTRKSERLIP